MSMQVSNQEDPRRNQKDRTRAAIVEAAAALMRDGVTPTVTSAAEAARVSRPTAYRYFPSQESLLTEIQDVTPSTEPVEALLQEMTGADARQRLADLLDAFNPIVIENEGLYRAALRQYLETWFAARKSGLDHPDVRFGRRIRWLDRTLEPLKDRLSQNQFRRLINALALTIGGDSMVIMKDACGLDNDEALEVLRWTAMAILDSALRETTESSDQRQP
jgi:AcrR family transcriptional regulator